MANPQNTPPNPKPPQTPPAAPASAPKTQAAPAPAAAPTPPPVAAAAAAPPPPPVAAAVAAPPPAPAAAPSTALAIAQPPTPANSAAEAFDPALWSQKSIDLWAENATALLDFAERLAQAKTIDEMTSLQSRFVSERFDALLRQSTELMTFAQRLFAFSFAPLSKVPAA